MNTFVPRVSPRFQPTPTQRLLGHLLTTAQTGADPAAAARAGVAGGSGFRLAVLAVRGMAGLAEPVAVLEGQQVRAAWCACRRPVYKPALYERHMESMCLLALAGLEWMAMPDGQQEMAGWRLGARAD